MLVGGKVFVGKLGVVEQHHRHWNNNDAEEHANDEDSGACFGNPDRVQDEGVDEAEEGHRQGEEEGVEVLVVVQADGGPDEGAVMVEDQHAAAGHAAVLGAEGTGDPARVAEGGNVRVRGALALRRRGHLLERLVVPAPEEATRR